MITKTETATSGAGNKRARAKRRTSEATVVVTTSAAPQSCTKPLGLAKPPSKTTAVIKLLSRPKGATGPELAAATDWQPHSVRAYLTGLRKKGHTLMREPRRDGALSYRLTVAAAPPESSLASVAGMLTDGSGEASPESADPVANNIGAAALGAAAAAAA